MSFTRRDFLKAGATAASLAALPRPLRAAVAPGARPYAFGVAFDPDVRPLAMRALDAAKGAGAAYADVRMTHGWLRGFGDKDYSDTESMEVGVRALVDGYWGFASGPVWSPDEMARLGREAVHQAKTNALGKPRVVELAPAPVVDDGRWETPVEIDPFTISPFEIIDHLRSLDIFTARSPRGESKDGFRTVLNDCHFAKQEKTFASTEGSYITQRLSTGSGDLQIVAQDRRGNTYVRTVDLLTVASVGWELYSKQPVRETIERYVEEIRRDMTLPVKPVDVGRYDAAIDAWGVATLLGETLGRATELDRALGYEANAGGTSYLNAPLEMVGSYHAGAPLLTITGNRTAPGGAATVKWDDEGVVPDEFPIVRDGVLVDFQTTRESAGWLKDYYAKAGRPVRSHGCAYAPTAIDAPLQQPPNLVLRPGREALDHEAMVAGLADGIEIAELQADMDFQHLNGMVTGRMYEVKRGKRVALIAKGAVLFRAPELWKRARALGGAASARRFGMWTVKGEPAQAASHSVTAVPAVFEQVTLIDVTRKA